MTDTFDTLIDKFQTAVYERGTLKGTDVVGYDSKRNLTKARSALRAAIDEVVKKNVEHEEETRQFNDGVTVAKNGLPYIQPHYQNDHDQWRVGYAWAMFDKLQARVAALEAEYEEAMQFILAVNQPHDYDCAHYVYDKNPCDCGYQKLVDTYMSKRGQG